MKRLTGAASIAALSLVMAVLPGRPAGATSAPAGADVSTFLASPVVKSLLVEPENGRAADVAAALRAGGWKVQSVGETVLTVAAGPDPTTDLRRIGQLPGVRSATTSAVAVNSATDPLAPAAAYSQVSGEGAQAVGVPEWRAAGITGKNTRIAIIDTGFADWAAAAAATRVPPMTFDSSRDINECTGGFEQTNHGTATAEVIHDIAPDAELVRVCINDAAGLARAIPRVIASRVQVANMSVGFYNTARGDGQGGPLSPDNSVRQAVGAGILWVNSAGNEAQLHWAGPFTDPTGAGVHQWQPGRSTMAFTLPPKSPVTLYLKWDEWTSRPTDEFAICVARQPTDDPSCFPADVATRGTPTASIGLTNPYDQGVTLYASVKRTAGAGNPRLDAFWVGAGAIESPVPASSLAEPAAVEGVVAVGAECTGTGLVRPYSSRGPTLDGRPGITLVAPSASSTFIFGPARGCEGGYAGTSVSAPHVAGAVALLHELIPDANNPRLMDQLRQRAVAPPVPGTPRPDTAYGYGVLNLGPPTPPVVPPGQAPASFAAYASGDQQVPPTDSPAWSWSEFAVGADSTTLQYSARVFGLRNPTAADLRLGSPGEPGVPVATLTAPGQPGSSGCVEVASYTILEDPAIPGSPVSTRSTPCRALTAVEAAGSDALCPALKVAPPPESGGDAARPAGYCGFADVAGTVTSLDLRGPLAGHPVSELIELIRQGKVSLSFSNALLPDGAIRGQLVGWSDTPPSPPPTEQFDLPAQDQAVLANPTQRTGFRRRKR